MADENYYQILSIPRDADERMIKRAYHKLARELHPDKAETPEKAREVEQRFALVSQAYNTLKDADQRREYDVKTYGQSKAPGAEAAGSAATAAALKAAREKATQAQKPAAAAPSASSSSSQTSGTDVVAGRAAIAQKAFARGLSFMKEGNFGKAAEFFEAAIQNNDKEAMYFAQLAAALIQSRRSAAKAIEMAKKAIELDTYNLDYKFTLAGIYSTIGSKSNAQKVYEEILRWDEKNEMATQMLRELNKKENPFDKIANKLLGRFKAKSG